jgi:hypothetical protein
MAVISVGAADNLQFGVALVDPAVDGMRRGEADLVQLGDPVDEALALHDELVHLGVGEAAHVVTRGDSRHAIRPPPVGRLSPGWR